MDTKNLYLDRVFEHIGAATRPGAVPQMPLGIFARECERVAAELRVAPPPTHHADKGLRLSRGLLERAANIARGIDKTPTRHLEIAAQHLNEDEAFNALGAIYRKKRR